MTALNPCRFCGETKRLSVTESGCEENLWGITDSGDVTRERNGKPTSAGPSHGDDLVCCDVCGASVPMRIWNASPEWLAVMRANVLAADAEYDADGVWRGEAVAA